MMRIDDAVATFLLNAVWQIGLVACLTRGLVIPLRASAASLHRLWAFSLVLSLMLPLASLVPREALMSLSRVVLHQDAPSATTPSLAVVPMPASNVGDGEVQRDASDFHLPRWLSLALTTAYGLFLTWRLALSGRAWIATSGIRRTAHPILLSGESGRVAEQCRVAFGLRSVTVVSSPSARGPGTLGLRVPIIVLPQRLLTDLSVEDWTVILGHEMAHVRRRDFGMNLLYELLYLPVSFHPLAAFVKRHMARSREQACDDMVVGQLISPLTYARSLLRIAGRISVQKEISYAVAACGGESLEERIGRLLTSRPRKRSRSAGWTCVVAGLLSVSSGVGYAAAVRVGPAVGFPLLLGVATTLNMRIAAPATVRHPPISVFEKSTTSVEPLRNARAASLGTVRDVTNAARPFEVLAPDTTLRGDSSAVPPPIVSRPSAALSLELPTDIEPIRKSTVGAEHGAPTGTLLAASQAAAAKLASADARSLRMPSLSHQERFSEDLPLLTTKKRWITWVAAAVGGGYALRGIDLDRDDHDKERHDGR